MQATHPYHTIAPDTSTAERLAEQFFGIKTEASHLPGEIDFNFQLKTAEGKLFVLKISRPEESKDLLEMQYKVMDYLATQHLPLQLQQAIPGPGGRYLYQWTDEQGRERWVRLVTWAPGRLFAQEKPHTPELLESLGAGLGILCKGLQGFDHAAAHRSLKWDLPGAEWVAPHLSLITEPTQREILDCFLALFRDEVKPSLPRLRRSFIYNDANDYNVLVNGDLGDARVTGFIDFGDALYTQVINDLAVAIAYSVLDKPDPLAAALHIVSGFHKAFPLQEEEIAVLYHLVAIRLVISVVNSAINREKEPENEYLLISERPAWQLLAQWRSIPPAFAQYAFRNACGWDVNPHHNEFIQWAKRQAFHPMLGFIPEAQQVCTLDLSVGSLDLGHNLEFEDTPRFCKKIDHLLEEAGAEIGIGGYGEVRSIYTTDHYTVIGNEGPQWRTVHLGLDIWARAGTPIFAPIEGTVHSFQNNDSDRNYGPTIILRHTPADGPVFYTLYGHLSVESLQGLKTGMPIQKGQRLAAIGPPPENGNWPPHLHFQVMLDMLGWEGDYPGVAFPTEAPVWLGICPDPALLAGVAPVLPVSTPVPELLKFRQEHLGPNLSLSYRQPLHIVRAYRQYLYDHTGRRYLDTVNNVPHVGHQHPRVVEALQKQAAVLNTNTRYLHSEIIAFAGELLATFPPELSVVYFVNSGSEANELALRMARTATGQHDMIVLQHGYHGNTTGCVDISSYKFDGRGGNGAPPHTHVLPMPDGYRGAYKGHDETTGAQYAATVDPVLQSIVDAGRKPAAFIAETILSCGGQIVPPPGYLQKIYTKVRAAGGLCIADEVQTGLGRVGAHWWAFETQDVVPDIVTIGKPLGNGHPLGAVVCSRAVADVFANGMEYFNTFGGNPVSCAVGRAVLKVIKEEGLRQNALDTGHYLLQQLQSLQKDYPIIGDVRGMGLFSGFELIRDPNTLDPATKEAAYLINRMRTLGILMSTDGPLNNVIKIKPPMCFSRRDVESVVEGVKGALEEIW